MSDFVVDYFLLLVVASTGWTLVGIQCEIALDAFLAEELFTVIAALAADHVEAKDLEADAAEILVHLVTGDVGRKLFRDNEFLPEKQRL